MLAAVFGAGFAFEMYSCSRDSMDEKRLTSSQGLQLRHEQDLGQLQPRRTYTERHSTSRASANLETASMEGYPKQVRRRGRGG